MGATFKVVLGGLLTVCRSLRKRIRVMNPAATTRGAKLIHASNSPMRSPGRERGVEGLVILRGSWVSGCR